MLSLIPDTSKEGKFRKRHEDPRIIDTINKHLADQRETHMSADEKPTMAEDIKIDVPPNMETAVRHFSEA